MTRTQNSFFNFITGFGSSLLVVVLDFVTRTVFIHTLGRSYLGIEGLFTNILSMLSLAELGFGSAIVFKLYKPIEENDRPRILVLLKLYRKTYLVVGCVVMALGLCLIPFLPWLVKDYEQFAELGLNGIVIFLIYLFKTASSYWFFAYKTAFVQANQKTYFLTIVGYALSLISSLCQILVLVLFKSFVLYICVLALFSVITNLVWARVCDKRYPYVNEKTNQSITKEERQEFFKDCSALLLYRASNVIIGGSDNIVLSKMLGLDAVALYANYVSLKTALQNLLYTFLKAIQASLGSLYTTGNLEWSRLIFRVVNFITFWLYGIGAIGLAILSDDFISLWVGSDYVVTSWSSGSLTVATPMGLLIGIETYVTGQKYYCGSFRNAMGLFQQLKYRPVASILVNLAFSILLVPHLGIAGCVISTIISSVTVNLVYDPLIIFRHALKQSPTGYYLKNLLYKAVVVVAGLISWQLCALIPLTGILGFLAHGCVCVIVPCAVFSLCFFRTSEFRFVLNTAKTLLPGHRKD